MLALYKPPRRSSEGTNISIEEIPQAAARVPVPAGTPYLTKVNGKLVMAREKAPKTSDIAIDLLGEAFGRTKTVVHKRTRSASNPHGSLLLNGELYIPVTNQQVMPYTAPIPQQPWAPTPNLGPFPGQPCYPMPPPGYLPLQQPSAFTSFFIPNGRPPQMGPQMGFGAFPQMQPQMAQFSGMSGDGAPATQPQANVETTKTTMTVTKHVCAGCGRIRSKKYHHLHPLKEGEKPAPDFCRKCQKDSSSSDTEGPSKEKKRPSKKSKQHSRRLSEDYIIVEEELSEEEVVKPRSRGRVRERVVEEYEIRRDSPPRSRQPSRTRPRSTRRDTAISIPRKPVRSSKSRESDLRAMLNRGSPPIEYRHVEGAQNSRVVAERVETYPKKIPINFYDVALQEQVPPAREHHKEASNRERESFKTDFGTREPLVARQGHPRHYFEDRETASSARSQSSRQRRRRERSSSKSPVLPPWEGPHEIHPRGDDDVIVVTERFEYRPKNRNSAEENRRRQEYAERSLPQSHARPYQLSAQEAARYYHEDWSRAAHDREPVREPFRRGEYAEPSYRRDRPRNVEISGSEASFEYRPVDRSPLPRVPSPPSSIDDPRREEISQDRRPYPLSSESEDSVDPRSKRKRPQRPTLYIPREHQESTSRVDRVHERGSEDEGLTYSRRSSPNHSCERERIVYVDEISGSERARVERAAEASTRRVTFREEPDTHSLHESWTTTTEALPSDAERGGRARRGGGAGGEYREESDWDR